MNRAGPGRGLALLVDAERAVAALWRQHLAERSTSSRRALFDHYRVYAGRLASDHARRLGGLGLELPDFEQLAVEALLQSIDRFNPAQGVRFETFTRLRIKGHIRNTLAKASEASAQHSYRRRVERERLASLRDADGGEAPISIDALAATAARIAIGLILEEAAAPDPDQIAAPDASAYDTLAWRQLCGELDRRLAHLPEREAFIIDHHYRGGLQFQQIALLMGLSKGRVSQLHAQALERLRKHMSRIG